MSSSQFTMRARRRSLIFPFFTLLLLLTLLLLAHVDAIELPPSTALSRSTTTASPTDSDSRSSTSSSSPSSPSSPSSSSASSVLSASDSSTTSRVSSSNSSATDCIHNCPLNPCANVTCSPGTSCVIGVISACNQCAPAFCKAPIGSGVSDSGAGAGNGNNNSGMIGGLAGGMVCVVIAAVGIFAFLRYRKRSRAGLPFWGRDLGMEMGKKRRLPSGDFRSHESWAGLDVGSGLDVSHNSAVIPIAYYPPGSNTSSIVVTPPLEDLAPPRAVFMGTMDRTSVRSENPFDDLEDEDAVEIKRAVVTKPLRTFPRGPSQTTLVDPSERHVSAIPDQNSEYSNPTHSMIIDHLSADMPGGDRDSVASSVVISSGVAKLASTSNIASPNSTSPISPMPSAKPTLVRVDTLSRSNSAASRKHAYAAGGTNSAMTSTSSLSNVPLVPSRLNPNESTSRLPNVTVHNASSPNLASEDSPFSDRHSASDYENETLGRPQASNTQSSQPGSTLLTPNEYYSQRSQTDSVFSNTTSLYSSDGEITIFWGADDPRRSAAESEASGRQRIQPRDTLGMERVISFAETEGDGERPRDTMATDGRVISLFSEAEEEER